MQNLMLLILLQHLTAYIDLPVLSEWLVNLFEHGILSMMA